MFDRTSRINSTRVCRSGALKRAMIAEGFAGRGRWHSGESSLTAFRNGVLDHRQDPRPDRLGQFRPGGHYFGQSRGQIRASVGLWKGQAIVDMSQAHCCVSGSVN
jgi:hypothetical protein